MESPARTRRRTRRRPLLSVQLKREQWTLDLMRAATKSWKAPFRHHDIKPREGPRVSAKSDPTRWPAIIVPQAWIDAIWPQFYPVARIVMHRSSSCWLNPVGIVGVLGPGHKTGGDDFCHPTRRRRCGLGTDTPAIVNSRHDSFL